MLLAFLFGCMGSIAIEVVAFLKAMGPRGAIPGKYKTKVFWIPRAILAFVSGGLACAYYAPNIPNYLYVHIGAATPALLLRGLRSDEASEDKPKPD